MAPERRGTDVRFEHLIEINDPALAEAPTLTREQIWRGLVLRAERPDLFVPSLSEVRLLSRTGTRLSRALRYGEVTVRDEVHFSPLEHMHYEIPAQGEIARSSLHVSIEEPRPGALFVRFVYEDERAESAESRVIDELRRAAYEQADIDTIVTIRWWLEAGITDPRPRATN